MELTVLLIVFLGLGIYVGAIAWALLRGLSYLFTRHQKELHIPLWVPISVVLGIWIPIANVVVVLYLLFLCKSVNRLVRERRYALDQLSPEELTDWVEKYILEAEKTEDTWVREVWRQRTTEAWSNQLKADQASMRRALEEKVTIHISSLQLYADWCAVIQHMLYLHERQHGAA